LTQQHGHITPETLYRDIAGLHATGDCQVAVMDPEAQEIWLSYNNFDSGVKAHSRPLMHIKLNDFWSQPTTEIVQ